MDGALLPVMTLKLTQPCDIFCKVVDNFGDLGVCWRLATQLAARSSASVRLWVDNIDLAQRFADLQAPPFALCHWQDDQMFADAAPVVLETFSCGLPAAYRMHMTQASVWINLDYLSAEPWVENFHLKPSPQANGLVRYFYYPGFTPATGGLLGASPRLPPASALFARLGLSLDPNSLNISLFCYADAPMQALVEGLVHAPQPSQLWVPEVVMPGLCQALDRPVMAVGESVMLGPVRITCLPFLSQPDYDTLLAACDLNVVRGEDSWIRAIWANKPFIWAPYVQSEATHFIKLNAFLGHYLADVPAPLQTLIQQLMVAWSGQGDLGTALHGFFAERQAIQQHVAAYTNALSQQPDLLTKLVFCIENLQKNRV